MTTDLLDLDLGAPQRPRTRGRQAAPLSAEYARDVGPAELAALAEPRPTGQTPAIAKIRERHHAIARLLATGSGPGEVAAITGYSLSRISILTADPQMAELIEHYRKQENERFLDLREQMTTLSKEAWAELADRLDDDPEKFSEAMLLQIATATADRVGHSGKGGADNGAAVNLTINIAEKMQSAMERLGRAGTGNGAFNVIDGKVVAKPREIANGAE